MTTQTALEKAEQLRQEAMRELLDEKKRIKEEEKLRKKERKQGQVPEDADQQ